MTQWSFEANYFTACNCDWGCPCNFNARPTERGLMTNAKRWWWRDDELLASYADKYGAVARVRFTEQGCVG
jgi:hypothetical protein